MGVITTGSFAKDLWPRTLGLQMVTSVANSFNCWKPLT